MSKVSGAVSKVKNTLYGVKTQWKTPAEGKYVPYKEVAAYSVGGAGVYFITSMVGQITLAANSMIVGASIGLKAMDLQTINVIPQEQCFLTTHEAKWENSVLTYLQWVCLRQFSERCLFICLMSQCPMTVNL